jgi:hypothetical protein
MATGHGCEILDFRNINPFAPFQKAIFAPKLPESGGSRLEQGRTRSDEG